MAQKDVSPEAPTLDVGEMLNTVLKSPAAQQAVMGILMNYFQKTEKERTDTEGLLERKRELAKTNAFNAQRTQDELEAFQEACLHITENGADTTLGGQGTHKPGHWLIGCCTCGKVYTSLNEIPPHLRNRLDPDAIGGPQNTQVNLLAATGVLESQSTFSG